MKINTSSVTITVEYHTKSGNKYKHELSEDDVRDAIEKWLSKQYIDSDDTYIDRMRISYRKIISFFC